MSRFRPYSPSQRDPSTSLRPIKNSLDQVLRALGSPPVDKLTLLHEEWAEIVGEAIASVTQIGALVDGRLSVAVPDGGWASQLRWMEADLVRKIEAFLGPGVVLGFEVRVRPH